MSCDLQRVVWVRLQDPSACSIDIQTDQQWMVLPDIYGLFGRYRVAVMVPLLALWHLASQGVRGSQMFHRPTIHHFNINQIVVNRVLQVFQFRPVCFHFGCGQCPFAVLYVNSAICLEKTDSVRCTCMLKTPLIYSYRDVLSWFFIQTCFCGLFWFSID